MQVVYRPALRREEQAAVDLWVKVFEVDAPFFRSLLDAEPRRRMGQTLVAVEKGGRIVASVQIFLRRKVGLDGRIDLVGGIGSVSTLEEARGHGHALRLMQLAVERMRAYDCAYSLLFTGINAYYEKVGFHTVATGATVGTLAEGWRIQTDHVVRPVRELYEPTLRAMRRAFDHNLGTRPLADVRPWRQWRTAAAYRLAGTRNDLYVVSPPGGEAFAYATARWSENSVDVVEWGAEPGSQAALRDVLAAVRDDAARRGISRVSLGPAIGPGDEAALGALVQSPVFEPWGWIMAQPLGPDTDRAYLDRLFAHPLARLLRADDF